MQTLWKHKMSPQNTLIMPKIQGFGENIYKGITKGEDIMRA